MDKVLQLDSQAFLDYYESCDAITRESLKSLFNAPIIEYLTFKIKSYEDASNRLYGKDVLKDSNITSPKLIANIKLHIITEALNDGWKNQNCEGYIPTFKVENNKFTFKDYAWFSNSRGFDKNDITSNVEFIYRDPELAIYSGKTFINYWMIYYENMWHK